MGRSVMAMMLFAWTLLLGGMGRGHGFVRPISNIDDFTRTVARRRLSGQSMKARKKEQLEVVQVVDSLYSGLHRTEDRLGLALDKFDQRLGSFQQGVSTELQEQGKELQEQRKELQEVRSAQTQLRNLFIGIPVIAGVLANLSTVLETYRKFVGK